MSKTLLANRFLLVRFHNALHGRET
jgi:hypothetical protein